MSIEGATVDDLLLMAKAADPSVRLRGVQELGDWTVIARASRDQKEAMLNCLLASTYDQHIAVRAMAVSSLGNLSDDVHIDPFRFIDRLLEITTEDEADVRAADIRANAVHALWAFGFMMPSARQTPVVDRLVELAEDSAPKVRAQVAKAFTLPSSKMIPPERLPAIIDLLLTLTHDSDDEVRDSAVSAFCYPGEVTVHVVNKGADQVVERIVDRLLELTEDPSAGVRGTSAMALTCFEKRMTTEEALKAVNRELELTEDEDATVRVTAVRALDSLTRYIPPEHCTPVALRFFDLLVEEEDRKVLYDLKSHFADLLKRAPSNEISPIIDKLMQGLLESKYGIRSRFESVLADLALNLPEALWRPVIYGLLVLAADRLWDVRKRAIYALSELMRDLPQDQAVRMADHLVEILEDPDEALGYAAIGAFNQMMTRFPPEQLFELIDYLMPVAEKSPEDIEVNATLENPTPRMKLLVARQSHVVERLLRVTYEPNEDLQYDAMKRLGKLGRYVPDVKLVWVINRLRELADVTKGRVQKEATRAFRDLEGRIPVR